MENNHVSDDLPSDNAPEIRFTRYLYIGSENSEFRPSFLFNHDYFQVDKLPSVDELAVNPDKATLPIQFIEKAFTNGLAPSKETLIFALAVCAKQSKSEALREAAFTKVQTICASPQHFFLFLKFVSHLSKEQTEPKSGWGHGLRRAVKTWYNNKQHMELAKIVTRYKGRYGWKHKDIIKLAHLKVLSIPHAVVFEYIMKDMAGLNVFLETKSKDCPEFSSPIVEEIKKYFEFIEDFKHCEDETRTAAILDNHELSLDHVPGHMLKSKEVWSALISSMDLTTLLHMLPRIHHLGFLKRKELIYGKVLDTLKYENVCKEKIHPAKILLALKNYENCGKPIYKNRKLTELRTPSRKIADTLYELLNESYKDLKPTGLRYLITVAAGTLMAERDAWQCANVTGADAAFLIALSLLRAEENVTIATYKASGFEPLTLNKSVTREELAQHMEQCRTRHINLAAPIRWARRNKQKIDVFINISHDIYEKCVEIAEVQLKAYREEQNIPNAKLVNYSMLMNSTTIPPSQDKNVLTIFGFNDSVPMVIEAFAKSMF